jgi:hypothetical protein
MNKIKNIVLSWWLNSNLRSIKNEMVACRLKIREYEETEKHYRNQLLKHGLIENLSRRSFLARFLSGD